MSGRQTGMAEPVQDACQWLLRRDQGPMPAPEAAACVAAAATAGGGARQQLDSRTSLLPTGVYTVDFTTSGGFSLRLAADDGNLEVRVDEERRELVVDGAPVPASSGGSPEEAYAEVLVAAAETTTSPDRLAAFLGAAEEISVQYDDETQGIPAVRLSARLPADGAAAPARNAVLWLDDFYRPVRIELSGAQQGIDFGLTAVNTGWRLP